MKNSNSRTRREEVQDRITFLEKQLEELNHYLPQTYELLMHELDCQRCELAHLDIQTAYAEIAAGETSRHTR